MSYEEEVRAVRATAIHIATQACIRAWKPRLIHDLNQTQGRKFKDETERKAQTRNGS